MEEIKGIYQIYLSRKNLKKFIKIYRKLNKLELGEIDLETVANVKNKLYTAYMELEGSKLNSIVLDFEISEYRVFLSVANIFIQNYKKRNNTTKNSSIQREFEEFLNNYKGANK